MNELDLLNEIDILDIEENVQSVQNVQGNEDYYLFPPRVYDNLPNALKNLQLAPNNYVSDISLLSILTSIGSCLPNIYGFYNKEPQFPNLYSFIVAPPASNKSSIEIGLPIINRVHDMLYQKSLTEIEVCKAVNKGSNSMTLPPIQIKVLPGATTASRLVNLLKENNHSLIVFETEADSLTNQLKSQYGQFSDILRKIFGNETVSKATMVNQRLDYVNNPKLAILLAGTSNQVNAIIKSVSDGLYSRFCFLNHQIYEKWKPAQFNEDTNNKKLEMEELESFLIHLHEVLHFRKNGIKITFTTEQTVLFNNELSKLHDIYLPDRPEILASIRRLGMIHCRLSLILTILRNQEILLSTQDFNEQTKFIKEIECTDIDFEISLDLVKILLNHALSVLDLYSTQKERFRSAQEKVMFYSLPPEFTTEQAIEDSNGFSESWVKKRLNIWESGRFIERVAHGRYIRKI